MVELVEFSEGSNLGMIFKGSSVVNRTSIGLTSTGLALVLPSSVRTSGSLDFNLILLSKFCTQTVMILGGVLVQKTD
jgi:hypothetical protein